MYNSALWENETNTLVIHTTWDRRRFKRWYRKKIEGGAKLEILEKGITEERANALIRRDKSIFYRISSGAAYSGKSYAFRRRDHWLDAAEPKLPLINILV